jgi:YD repeat-containing protein
MGNSVTVYKYLGNQLTEEETTTESIGKEEKIRYKYNDQGQLTEKKSKQYYFNTTITLTYTYNEIGKLIALQEKSSNGVSSKTTYQYDDKGLLMSDTWKSSLDKTPNTTRYIIEF